MRLPASGSARGCCGWFVPAGVGGVASERREQAINVFLCFPTFPLFVLPASAMAATAPATVA